MKKDKSKSQPSNDLCLSAEKRLSKKKAEDIQSMTEQDIRALVHELQVHQIELEMQNEELRRAQAELEASQAKYSDLYDFAPVGYFTFDKNGIILKVNLTGASLLGEERSYLIKKLFALYINKEDKDMFRSHINRVFETGTRQHCEIKVAKKDGAQFYANLESIVVQDSKGSFIQCRTSMNDITERKRAEDELRIYREYLEELVKVRTAELEKINEQLEIEITERKRMEDAIKFQAYYDFLTSLPNRILFMDHLKLALAQGRRDRKMLAVLFIDLDYFKNTNDLLGHAAGDQLLKGVADRLKTCTRESDTVARIGGDEFIMLIAHINHKKDASRVAEKTLSIFQEPYIISDHSDHELHISASVGISIYPEDGENPEALMKNADIAMYYAKEQGRNNYRFYNPAMKKPVKSIRSPAARI